MKLQIYQETFLLTRIVKFTHSLLLRLWRCSWQQLRCDGRRPNTISNDKTPWNTYCRTRSLQRPTLHTRQDGNIFYIPLATRLLQPTIELHDYIQAIDHLILHSIQQDYRSNHSRSATDHGIVPDPLSSTVPH